MTKYEVEKKYVLIYVCIFIACLFLVMCRWINVIDPTVVLLPQMILLHATNFALSLMVMLSFGFTVLVFGGKKKMIVIAGVLLAALNIIYELVCPLLNTVDIADALFGLLGIGIAYVYLIQLKKNGLIMK